MVAKRHVERRLRANVQTRSREASMGQNSAPEKRLVLPKSLDDTAQSALNFFFSIYVSTTDPWDTRGHLDFLTPLYPQAPPESTLALSTLALASCLYNAWKCGGPDEPLSKVPYVRAISAMKENISRRDACANDDMLLSVLLLQQYEVSCAALPKLMQLTDFQMLVNTATRRPHIRAHLDGALAIVKYRGLHSFSNRVSQGLLLCVRAQLVWFFCYTDEELLTK